MKQEILVPHGAIKKISEDTGFTPTTVRFALRGVTESAGASLIRKRAIEAFGGVRLKRK